MNELAKTLLTWIIVGILGILFYYWAERLNQEQP